jgi:adenosylcobinamide-phosphate synthase
MDAGWTTTGVLALWLALALDWLAGEPQARWHPVVWMGRYLGWTGRRIAPLAQSPLSADYRRFAAGAAGWCLGAVVCMQVAWAVELAARWLPTWAAVFVLAMALKPLFAWNMLRTEVVAVETALATSLDAGREQLAYIVSRDVTLLDEGEVRESAIESLAENLNDSVVAPLFWYALLGLPGAALYRFANTADAMWGYHGVRGGRVWEWAGKWAARADDVLSWIPARLTALLLYAVALRWPVRLRKEARRTPSPNSGWPMAAMALLLKVRLGKPGFYALNEAARSPEPQDTERALSLGARAVLAAGLCAAAGMFGIAHLAGL